MGALSSRISLSEDGHCIPFHIIIGLRYCVVYEAPRPWKAARTVGRAISHFNIVLWGARWGGAHVEALTTTW